MRASSRCTDTTLALIRQECIAIARERGTGYVTRLCQRGTVAGVTTANLKLLVEARAAASSGSGIEVRRAAGLSQGELARAAGINPATLSRWESQERQPSGDAALRYARVLRVLEGG